ncbi:NUDIX domain-containing protein [Buchnera aphidicola (Sitobion avenae)]|uniref:8-oxo-dGTP diphosphatase n=1 Tax=Buchnera aphidicola (Sitobion avenae) TaxID=571428 RepID=A0A4D6YI17_9GAMM|nr:NUDIX domain-containing protein [Buchnera aphidicola]QCI25420.1 NUDIX domain-containing protein [Buchnera aphidicola (Sitobion avenae)]
MKDTEAVIGIIIHGKKIYVTRGKYKTNIWEFPGGKVKKHESIMHALKRELLEEVGIIVIEVSFFQYTEYVHLKKKIKLYFFLIKKWKGQPYSIEGYSYHWKFVYNLRPLDFPLANHHVIMSLKNKYLFI